jgi:hypothetical protein
MPTMRKYLIVLLLAAVALIPGAIPSPSVASAADPVQAAVQWLHTQQLPDGGFGVRGVASAAMTADVVYALALAGEDPGGPAWTVGSQSALDALARVAPKYIGTDAGQAGKVGRAVAAAGRDPRSFGGMDIIAVIEAAYDPATGRYHPNFLFRHTLAMDALQRSHLPVPPAACSALRSAQLPDGGWFWTFDAQKADVDTTGRVLQVLGQRDPGQRDIAFTLAADYLARAQATDGAWAADGPESANPVNANSTALAVGGLRAVGRNPDADPYVKGGRGGLQALLAFQEPSGAFAYIAAPGKEEVRLTATTDALISVLATEGAAGPCPSPYLPVILASE